MHTIVIFFSIQEKLIEFVIDLFMNFDDGNKVENISSALGNILITQYWNTLV